MLSLFYLAEFFFKKFSNLALDKNFYFNPMFERSHISQVNIYDSG